MNKSWNTQKIAGFVREILGCGCPEHVFEKIEVSKTKKGVLPFDATRINVGNTLLIYIVRPKSAEGLRAAIRRLISVGREDRDVNGFNRFRLVFAEAKTKIPLDVVAETFAAEAGGDEKMHFHFVQADSVRGL